MMAARAYFLLCLILGRLLRSGRYATIRMAGENGDRQVRKRRLFHAPFLIWIGGPLLKLLDTGVEILPQSRWQERERRCCRNSPARRWRPGWRARHGARRHDGKPSNGRSSRSSSFIAPD
jgi:hypothetical protein